jgi:hypothetical protein
MDLLQEHAGEIVDKEAAWFLDRWEVLDHPMHLHRQQPGGQHKQNKKKTPFPGKRESRNTTYSTSSTTRTTRTLAPLLCCAFGLVDLLRQAGEAVQGLRKRRNPDCWEPTLSVRSPAAEQAAPRASKQSPGGREVYASGGP